MVTQISPLQNLSRIGTTCSHAALRYAQKGLPVFPLCGKIPYAGSRGFYDATTDPEIIECWWRQWPTANIGVPTGERSGWVVLDVDLRHGGFTSLQVLLDAVGNQSGNECRSSQLLPATRAAYTGGGGLHLVFSWRDDLGFTIKNITGLRGHTGLDIRGEGGYIVVAPSLHASGQRYEWLNMESVAPFPDLLADLCYPPGPASQQVSSNNPIGERRRGVGAPLIGNPEYYLSLALGKAQVGSRHHYALFLACRLIEDAGLSMSQAESYMREYARCVPTGEHAYTEHEALRCLQWASCHAWKGGNHTLH